MNDTAAILFFLLSAACLALAIITLPPRDSATFIELTEPLAPIGDCSR